MGVEIHIDAKLQETTIHAKARVAAKVGGVRVGEFTIIEADVELDESKVRFHESHGGMSLKGYLQWLADKNEIKCKVEACVGSGALKKCSTARAYVHVDT